MSKSIYSTLHKTSHSCIQRKRFNMMKLSEESTATVFVRLIQNNRSLTNTSVSNQFLTINLNEKKFIVNLQLIIFKSPNLIKCFQTQQT